MSRNILIQRDLGKFNWPLAVSTFTVLDKLKIAKWLLTNDRYTMGVKVEELEKKFTELSGMYSLCVASGSAANQLVFELWKIKNPNKKGLVIAPAVTWISSISPAIMAGFDVKFCDVNLKDFSFDYDMLEAIIKNNPKRRIIIWPTALIGFVPDMNRLNELSEKYNAELFMDSCENTLSKVNGESILSTCDITTTSCYFSHQVVMCEGGFVFFRNIKDYEIAKMFRNHGLTRSLPSHNKKRISFEGIYSDIDPQFLFAMNGTNLRPTDVHAMFGLMDFERIEKSLNHRNEIYSTFSNAIHNGFAGPNYYIPDHTPTHSGFCLPIFHTKNKLGEIKSELIRRGIEVRPIIGSNLLRQPPFKNGYGHHSAFKNAEWIHHHGCYVGLHQNVTKDMVLRLINILKEIK